MARVRPGTTARIARQQRAQERERELQRRRDAVVVRFPRRWERYDGVSLGRCVAWGEVAL